ncbi:hypothetical protein CDD81_8161 [Ophiocordyceps australis]|uniref:Uncharacterized protein n=1 Tax=Ophiocordyceps australis TaxID=1399860 RepID=A0A2C5Y2D9_9HYPO|nr:hypothetical protein CDD81_8161 [Ophiocordyceps australis]
MAASFGRQFSAASPVMAMKPSPARHSPLHATARVHSHTSSSLSGITSPRLIAGRKRCRDEASIDADADQPSPIESLQASARARGFILAVPKLDQVVDSSSHSPSHKSQRIHCSVGQASPLEAATSASSSKPAPNANGPVIDDFTVQLGIGWRRINHNKDIQAAARGWARFIENQFALSNVRICLESKGLESYLVEATEGHFLFSEDLRHGRLVSRTVDGALRNLQTLPPVFDGAELTVGATASQPFKDTEMRLD